MICDRSIGLVGEVIDEGEGLAGGMKLCAPEHAQLGRKSPCSTHERAGHELATSRRDILELIGIEKEGSYWIVGAIWADGIMVLQRLACRKYHIQAVEAQVLSKVSGCIDFLRRLNLITL